MMVIADIIDLSIAACSHSMRIKQKKTMMNLLMRKMIIPLKKILIMMTKMKKSHHIE